MPNTSGTKSMITTDASWISQSLKALLSRPPPGVLSVEGNGRGQLHIKSSQALNPFELRHEELQWYFPVYIFYSNLPVPVRV